MDLLPTLRRLILATSPIPGVGGPIALTVFRLPPPRTIALSEAHEAIWERRATGVLTLGSRELAVHRWVTPLARKRVLLAHGWAMNARLWMAWIEPLQRAGLEPVALDFPAHGASTGHRADPERFGRALSAVMGHSGPFHAAIGHSAGAGALASGLGRDQVQPTPERLALLGAPASVDALFDYFQRKLDLPSSARIVAERAFNHRFGPQIRERSAGADLARLGAAVMLAHDHDDASVPIGNLGRILAEGGQAAESWSVLRTRGLGHQGIVQDEGVIEETVAFLRAG